ncbi:12799_t:CDS:1 [Racocetra persica]|uniref:12799_t:CDS:1 n=1 Tax=Racocetra persica TaxID=160502 RepID=A0ACA9NMS6_9GLOM|nr:12799_t:CDS:1 [Racocetra persica]
MFAVVTVNNTLSSSSTTTQRPSVVINFLYKLTEIAAYTSVIFNDFYQIISAGDKIKQEVEKNDRISKRINNRYPSIDMLQISVDDSNDPDV